MDEEPLIGIVTVLYNSQTVLKDFFNSLDKQHYRNIVLYVVDNKSPDDSLLQAKLLSTNCSFKSIFIENYCNEGIAKGNNLGIEKAISDGCEFILLSNNDVVIYEDTITNLYNRLTKKKVSISVPKIYMYDNKHIWFAGGSFSKLTFLAHHIGFNSKDLGQYDQEKYITYSPTCFMLIHRSVFKSVGMMDGKFFVYWDDTDFVFRALKQKYKILYVPTSKLEHKESVSTGIYLRIESILLLSILK